jgi:hypothetical protein
MRSLRFAGLALVLAAVVAPPASATAPPDPAPRMTDSGQLVKAAQVAPVMDSASFRLVSLQVVADTAEAVLRVKQSSYLIHQDQLRASPTRSVRSVHSMHRRTPGVINVTAHRTIVRALL